MLPQMPLSGTTLLQHSALAAGIGNLAINRFKQSFQL
jgi:hypothetical protein